MTGKQHLDLSRTIRAASTAEMSRLFDEKTTGYEGLVIAGASGWIFAHTVSGLARAGIRPLALVDNNPSLWGSQIDGVPVLSPAEAVKLHREAAFVAAVFTHTPLRTQLLGLGLSRVVSYAHLFHKFPQAFLPYFAVDHPGTIAAEQDAVLRAAEIWADQESRDLYEAILKWFVTLDSESVPPPLPAKLTYLPDVLLPREDEVFVDCGAFNGDTVLSYASATGGRYERIFALEPDPRTFQDLIANVRDVERVTTLQAAAGQAAEKLLFVAGGSLASHAVGAGAEGLAIDGSIIQADVVRLDDLRPHPTYIKMDIEGFEQQALGGASRLLSEEKTAFAVTLYHHMFDLWRLPLYIHAAAPNLRLFLRHYAEDWAETICYAIPAARVGKAQTRPE